MRQQTQHARRESGGPQVSGAAPSPSVFVSAERAELDTPAFEVKPLEIEASTQAKSQPNFLVSFGRRLLDLSGADKFSVGLYGLNSLLQGLLAVQEIGPKTGDGIFHASMALLWGALSVARVYFPLYGKRRH